MYGEEEGSRRRQVCRETHKSVYAGKRMPSAVVDHMKASGKIGGIRKGAGRGKKGWYKGIFCDSTWELAFVIWNIDMGVPIKRSSLKLPYTLDGKVFNYHPDFVIGNNKIVEIKGFLDKKSIAKKTQYPDITFLMKEDMVPYIEYAKGKAGRDDITVLYESGVEPL